MDHHRTPSGMPSPQLEDAIDQVTVHMVGTPVETAGRVPASFTAFFPLVSAPTTEGAPRNLRNPADLGGATPSLQVLSDDF